MAETYTTREGDTLDAIAFAHYGRHNGTTEVLLEANRHLQPFPLDLPAGVELTLPELVTEPAKPVRLYD